MKRIYHHYKIWEEVKNGMWVKLSREQEKQMLPKAIEFTGNAELYGEYMMKVIEQWPISCEQVFTNPSMNHLAWIGHAATCIALGCPEYLTRQAWRYLTQRQRDDANAKAEYAVHCWLEKQRTNGRQYSFNFSRIDE